MSKDVDYVYQHVPEKDCHEEREKPVSPRPKGLGARHTQALILFLSLSVAYGMRAHLSVSIVAMTNKNVNSKNNLCHFNQNETDTNLTAVVDKVNDTMTTKMNQLVQCTHINDTERNTNKLYQSYGWKKSTQEMIVFSFFVGYTSMMLPMGIMAQKFGGKIPICVALFTNAILSILTPWMALYGGWMAVSTCRLLQGMTQAAFYPSIHTILGKWAPLSERGRLSTYIYTGSQFGTVFAFQVSGLLAGNPVFGWPATFWVLGIISFICFGLVLWLGAATPQDHGSITEEELKFITGSNNPNAVNKRRKTPWKHILTCKAVWGMVVSHTGSVVGYLFVLTEIPLYMNRVLHVDIRRNGLYSSLPYIAMYIMSLIFGYLSDYCIKKQYLSIVNVRRIANSIGLAASGLFLLAFGFVSSTLVAVILLVLCIGLHSGVHVGFHINQIDLAPNFAGPIMALGNMVGNCVSLMVPVLVSNIVRDDVSNSYKWQMVMIIVVSVQLITNTIFVIFAKGEVQEWNFYGENDTDKETEKFVLHKIKEGMNAKEKFTKA